MTCCVFSPDGQTVLSGSSDETLKLWDLRSNTCETLTEAGRISCCAFSPDGSAIIVGWGDTLSLMHMATAADTCCYLIGHTEQVVSGVFSQDVQTVLSASESTIKLWNVGDVVKSMQQDQHLYHDMDFLRCFASWKHHRTKYTANRYNSGFGYSTFEGWQGEASFSHGGKEYRKTITAGRHVVYLGDQVVWRDLQMHHPN